VAESFKILARHRNWVDGATITESVRISEEQDKTYRRFTATVRGWQGFRVWEGYVEQNCETIIDSVRRAVREIRDKIDAGDDSVFHTK